MGGFVVRNEGDSEESRGEGVGIGRNNAWYLGVGGSTHAHWVQVNGANTCSIREGFVYSIPKSHVEGRMAQGKGGGGVPQV